VKLQISKAVFVTCLFIVGPMAIFPQQVGVQSGKTPATAEDLRAQLTSELRVNEVPTNLDIFVGPQGGTKGSEDDRLMIGPNRGQFGRQGTVHFTWT